MTKNKKIICWIVVIIVSVVLWFFYNWGGNLLKPVAIKQIKNITGARIDIEAIDFRVSGKVRLKNIQIGPLIKQSPDNSILTAQRLDVSFSPLSFFVFSPKIKRIKIENFVVNAQYNNDIKQWNLAGLKLPAGQKRKSLPQVRFKNGEIKFTQIDSGKETKTIDCLINSGFAKTERKDGLNVFTVTDDTKNGVCDNMIIAKWADSGDVKIEIDAQLPSLDLRLFGSSCNINSFNSVISADSNDIVFETANLQIGPKTIIDVNGIVSDFAADPAFVFGVKIQDLNVTHQPKDNSFAHGSGIFAKFIPLLQVFFDNFNPQGLLDLEVVLTGSVSQIAKTKCSGYLGCKDISIRYFEFPYLVEHLNGRIDVTETSMNMKNLKANHGAVDIVLNGYCDGFGETMDSRVVLSSNNMLLDDDLYSALLEHHKKLWYIFSPSGVVSGDFIYTAKPPGLRKMQLYADLLDVAIMCQYFPYPVGGITGKIVVDGDLIELTDVLSTQNGGQIRMTGKITDANTVNPMYNFNINARDVAVDSDLINAFPTEQKKFFKDFDMRAYGDADIYINSVSDSEIPVDYLAKLKLTAESIKHPILALPLTDARLDANLTPLAFNINKFSAKFNDSPVDAAGTVWTGADKKPVGYCMRLKALNLAVDSNIAEPILGAATAKIIDDYQFAGCVNLEAAVGKNSRIKCPELEIAVDCLSDTAVLIKPDLALKDITGRITIKPDKAEFLSLSATPAGKVDMENIPRIVLDGQIATAEGKIDTADLKLVATDMVFDDRISAAIGDAGKYYDKLDAAGSFDLNFDKVQLYRDPNNQQMVLIDGTAVLKNCSVGQAQSISNIYALCDVDVGYKVGGGLKNCQLFLDMQELSVMDRPVSNLKVPIVFDPEVKKIIVKNFMGDFLGGKISGNAAVQSDSTGRFSDYQMDMALSQVNTEGLISPADIQYRKLSGQTNSELNIHGNLQNPDVTIGRFLAEARGIRPKQTGVVSKIRSAIYETIKKDLALDNVTIESVIKGRQLQISQLDIFGPTASLRGAGVYHLDTDSLDIKMTAHGAAGQKEPGFIESLTAGFGPAFLDVNITGSLEKPKIEVLPLPIIKNSLNLIEK